MTTESELAAWEAATVQNLDPLLSREDAAVLWAAITANRETPSVSTFAEALRPMLEKAVPVRVLLALGASIDALRTLTAAPAAKD